MKKSTLFTSLLSVLVATAMAQSAFAYKPINEIIDPKGDFPESEYVKVAAVSFTPDTAPINTTQKVIDAFKKQTADDLEEMFIEAASNGAKLIVSPEFSLVGYPDVPELSPEEDNFNSPEMAQPYAETLNGPSVKRFGALAKKLKVYLIIGIIEQGEKKGILYNTTVALNPKGQVAASYRKINLFEIENKYLKAGNKRVHFDTEFGIRVGMIICFDIHFDNPSHSLVNKDKVDLVALSTSWVGENGMSSFKQFAAQFNVDFLAANEHYYPDSGIILAGGKIQSHIRQSDGPVYGYLKLKK